MDAPIGFHPGNAVAVNLIERRITLVKKITAIRYPAICRVGNKIVSIISGLTVLWTGEGRRKV